MISSIDELLVKLRDITLHRNQVLASLDAYDSLFTNVPVETTIDFIIATALKSSFTTTSTNRC